MTILLRSPDDVRSWLSERVYRPSPADPLLGKVGLEAEMLPFWLTPDGRPAARLALVEIIAVVESVAGAVRNPDRGGGRPSWQLDGALVTEEPGAQVEVAGPPEPDAATAIRGLERVIDQLDAAFSAAGAALIPAGLDIWSGPGQVPVQLDIPRYRAMTTYFRRREARQGHLLMCSSCSLQINVDLGPPAVAARRWTLANLAAFVLSAAFAASPTDGAVNGRSLSWRGLDPTRTGLPPPLVAGTGDPLDHALADALRADVLLVEREGRAYAGVPGWTFGDWVRRPHPSYGPATGDDLATHLSTLFPEVRLRGYLEVRGVDQLPRRWRAAAVALVVGLLYDEAATDAALDLLEPHRGDLPLLLHLAALVGLADPRCRRLAVGVLDEALLGARRLGIPQAAEAAEFLDTFTRRGRHPADDFRGAQAVGPAAAVAWCRS